jgi:hypothetical protein
MADLPPDDAVEWLWDSLEGNNARKNRTSYTRNGSDAQERDQLPPEDAPRNPSLEPTEPHIRASGAVDKSQPCHSMTRPNHFSDSLEWERAPQAELGVRERNEARQAELALT